jgi:hypothetical protein
MKRLILMTTALVAVFTASAMAEPLISGGEPDWGRNMSPLQRRAAGFDDVAVAQKHARKPNAPTRGVPGYAFNLITIKHSGRFGQILSEPFGVFASLQECDVARVTKIAELGGARLLHQDPNAPETTTHFNDGSAVTQQVPMKERMDVTFCEPGVYSPSLNPRIVPYTPAPKNLPAPGRRAAR